ncbi:MAG: WD40 repeat domain-containing protein, partial [Phycisphaerales bacterium]|nr:WD40 repeat domain-containing protein [Phycisphaerales bacterium]
PPRNLRLSPDGALMVGGSRDGLVRVWDAATLGAIGTLAGHETEVLGAGFVDGGTRVITTGTDGTVRTWDPSRQSARPLVLGGHTHLVHPIAIGQRGRLVFTGSWDKSVAAYSIDTGERVATAVLDDMVQHLVLSPDERLLAVREYLRPARILDAATLETVRTVEVDRSLDSAPMFDTASRRVVLGVSVPERTAFVLDIASGGCSTVPLSELRSFVGPTINARAGLIAVTGFRPSGFSTLVLRLDDGHEVLARSSLRVAIESMAFSDDGSRLAILGNRHEIDVIDTATMARVGVCRGHSREVLSMVFSPDGRRLFSADFTGVIRVWDTRTCDEVGQLRGHEGHIRRLAVSSDGKCLVSGSRDGTARVWAVP